MAADELSPQVIEQATNIIRDGWLAPEVALMLLAGARLMAVQ